MPTVTLSGYYVHACFVVSFTFRHPCDKKKVMWLHFLIEISTALLVPSPCAKQNAKTASKLQRQTLPVWPLAGPRLSSSPVSHHRLPKTMADFLLEFLQSCSVLWTSCRIKQKQLLTMDVDRRFWQLIWHLLQADFCPCAADLLCY